MENKNNNKGVIALLIVIIVILAVLCVLLATGTINFKSNVTNTNDTQTNSSTETQSDTTANTQSTEKDYVGEYTYTEKAEDVDVEYKATLSLVNDGTFYIKETATMKHYYYGTYEVVGDKLKLNYTFNWANAQGSHGTMNEQAECTISNGTITNTKNDKNVFASDKDITLTKTSNDITLAKEFTNDILNTYKKDYFVS